MPKPERLIRNDRKVDRFNLEVESEVQADLFGHYAREASFCKKIRDEKKDGLEKAKSSARLNVKTGNCTSYINLSGQKISLIIDKKPIKLDKDDINAIVALDPEVLKLQKEFTEAEAKHNTAKADENTMEHRRSSLNNLKDLYCKYYYENKDSGSGFTSKTDQISEKQSDALNKKKKKEA